MKPKEKAESLVNDFLDKLYDNGSLSFKRILYPKAKECAFICVDEIIKEVPTEILDTYKGETNFIENERYNYWHEVKNEIEKL